MMPIVTKVIFISAFIIVINWTDSVGSHEIQQADCKSRHNSAIKCAIDYIHGDHRESQCDLCVRCTKAKGKSVYMKRKNQNETCLGSILLNLLKANVASLLTTCT